MPIFARMSFIENLKTKIGKYRLMSSLAKRNPMRHIPAFHEIQEIAIIYQADQKSEDQLINQFAQHLREQGKKVMLLGFVNQKQLSHQYKFHITQEYIWKESLDFFNLPNTSKIHGFIQQPFDLLMNLHPDFCLPLAAISSYSKAKTRIGIHYPGAESFNEILIDGKFNSLFDAGLQMEHYLKIVNNTKP